jgi:hypothetical protein
MTISIPKPTYAISDYSFGRATKQGEAVRVNPDEVTVAKAGKAARTLGEDVVEVIEGFFTGWQKKSQAVVTFDGHSFNDAGNNALIAQTTITTDITPPITVKVFRDTSQNHNGAQGLNIHINEEVFNGVFRKDDPSRIIQEGGAVHRRLCILLDPVTDVVEQPYTPRSSRANDPKGFIIV